MYREALFFIAPNWKHSKYPSVVEQLNKQALVVYMCTGIQHSRYIKSPLHIFLNFCSGTDLLRILNWFFFLLFLFKHFLQVTIGLFPYLQCLISETETEDVATAHFFTRCVLQTSANYIQRVFPLFCGNRRGGGWTSPSSDVLVVVHQAPGTCLPHTLLPRNLSMSFRLDLTR